MSLRRSVVKLFTAISRPNPYQPWDFFYPQSSGGSGCVVDPGLDDGSLRVLTNAHVVSNAKHIQVLKVGGTRRFTATVASVDHDAEVALLTVDDPAFFEDTDPVGFGELPHQRDEVAVYGFPIGGTELSITSGVVSRIEVQGYTHSQRSLLALQVDAAINPGNSGGPVFRDKKLIGIAFQSYSGSRVENVGYVVPLSEIQRFLEDVRRGAPGGVPDLGIQWQRTDNEALRSYLGLGPDEGGVMVSSVVHGGSADGLLAEEDVLTHLDGVPIASDGSVPFRDDDRVRFTHLASRRHIGDVVAARWVRHGKAEEGEIHLGRPRWLVPRPAHDVRPRYRILAGLVFVPLTWDYLNVWPTKDAEPRFRHLYHHGLPSAEQSEVVLISQVLPHDLTVGYHRVSNAVVTCINGRRIGAMADIGLALDA
ncbi:MAG: trypsin-like peptidase domain-containing protein, partial [Myxococcota bacterium]